MSSRAQAIMAFLRFLYYLWIDMTSWIKVPSLQFFLFSNSYFLIGCNPRLETPGYPVSSPIARRRINLFLFFPRTLFRIKRNRRGQKIKTALHVFLSVPIGVTLSA